MTDWHPSNQPFTPHNAPKYWAGVMDSIQGSSPRATGPTRNDQPRIISGQPALTRSVVVTSGLADGPSG